VQTRQDLFSTLTGPTFALTVITIVPKRKERRVSAIQSDPSHERYLNDFTPDAEDQALADANKLTKEVYELVNTRGEIFLTSGVVGGIYSIRVVSAAPSADDAHIQRAFHILVETVTEVIGRG
jgi:aromatic-L-amino-acid/L-tryptophan decarboxylase